MTSTAKAAKATVVIVAVAAIIIAAVEAKEEYCADVAVVEVSGPHYCGW